MCLQSWSCWYLFLSPDGRVDRRQAEYISWSTYRGITTCLGRLRTGWTLPSRSHQLIFLPRRNNGLLCFCIVCRYRRWYSWKCCWKIVNHLALDLITVVQLWRCCLKKFQSNLVQRFRSFIRNYPLIFGHVVSFKTTYKPRTVHAEYFLESRSIANRYTNLIAEPAVSQRKTG